MSTAPNVSLLINLKLEFMKVLSSSILDNYLGIDCSKLLDPVVESKNLCGTNKGEIERVEEENQIFAEVVAQFQLLELAVQNRSSFPCGRRLGDHRLK